MADKLEILVKAVDQASGVLKTVDKEVEKLGSTGKSSGSKLKDTFGALAGQASGALAPMLGLAGGVAAVGGAVVATAKFVSSSVNDWVAYNEEIRKLGMATGSSVEDLSRLLQAADDVGVSMDSMKTAMGLAAKNGVSPTIENLANLSDKLLLITDDTQRADEMARIFGRGWQEVAGFILQGGDAIRQMSANIDTSMVVTERSAQQARDYAATVDELNDSWTGFKNTIGQAVLPILDDLLDRINYNIDSMKGQTDAQLAQKAAVAELDAAYAGHLITEQQYNEILMAINNASGDAITVTKEYGIQTQIATALEQSRNQAFDQGIASMQYYAVATAESTQVTKQLTESEKISTLALQEYNAMLMQTRNKAEGSQAALRRLEQNFLAAGYSAEEAAGMVAALKNQIAAIKSKDVIINVRINMPGGGYTVQGGQLTPTPFSPAEEIIYNKQYEDWLAAGSVGAPPTKGTVGGGPKSYKDLSDAEKTKRAKENRERAAKKKGAGGASGLDMIVPPGYPGDSFPIWTTSGERVTVETKDQQKRGGGDTYIMYVNTNAPVSTVISDFQMMRALGA